MNQENPTNLEGESFTWEGGEKKENRELSIEEKKELAASWSSMVVDGEDIPENIESMNNEQMKEWLYRSLMDDMERLIDEWGLKPDQKLIMKIQEKDNPDKKAECEIEYIKSIHTMMRRRRNSFENARKKKKIEKSNKWDSWPKMMRESKDFNCVGATIIGMKFLNDAGIESFHGSPSGHSINVVKLSNGDWYYVDFINDIRQTQNIDDIEEMEIEGVRVLKPKEPINQYKLIPIQENSEIPEAVLGNLSVLSMDAQDEKRPETHEAKIEKEEADKYLARYSDEYKETDFHKIKSILYPKRHALNDSEEMSEEHERIEFIQSFEQPIQEFTRSLSKKQIDGLIKEINKLKGIKEFFSGDDKILSESSETLRNILLLYRKNLEKVKTLKPEIYQEAIDMVIKRWEGLGGKK